MRLECPDFSITLRRHQLYLPSLDLEHYFGTDFTSAILQEGTDPCPHPRKIKEDISSKDRDLLLAKHEGRADMFIVVEVESEIGWPRLWDLVLDNGARCIEGLRNLLWVITFPPHAMHACPLCEREDICRDSLLSHVPITHTNCHLSSKAKSFHLSQTLTQSSSTNYVISLNCFKLEPCISCISYFVMPTCVFAMNFDFDDTSWPSLPTNQARRELTKRQQ